MFTRNGIVGTVIVGVLAGGASAAWPASPDGDENRGLPVIPAIYRVEQAATPAVGESQSTGTGVLRAALERWRGGGGGLPVTTAIYRVEQPEPGESSSTDPNSADDESESTGSDVKFDLVRWRGGWGRGWGGGWGGGWGRGWGGGWGRGWGLGYRGFGWGGGLRRFGWGWGGGFRGFGWGGYPGWGYGFYRPRFYRPFLYGGFGYPGVGYAYNNIGYGGYPLAYGGYGYPMYGGYW